jgi:Na+-transporting NADH:ubiquinone oxidoreductase subunit C
MTTVVALLLAGLSTILAPTHKKNELLYAKKSTLAAVSNHLGDVDFAGISDDQVESLFTERVEQIVIDMDGNTVSDADIEARGYKGGKAENVDILKEMKKPEADRVLPLFVYTKADGKKYYIVSTTGKGLWDVIWGCVAIEDDMNTIAGVSFDHKAETPGLGAEIKDNAAWVRQFNGKKLYEDGDFKSIYVRKGGARDANYEVDGISGATITGDGVTEMLERGIKYYEPFFKNLKG